MLQALFQYANYPKYSVSSLIFEMEFEIREFNSFTSQNEIVSSNIDNFRARFYADRVSVKSNAEKSNFRRRYFKLQKPCKRQTGNLLLCYGRYFNTGVPVGFSDIFGFRKSDGRAFFIEVKTRTGKLRLEQKQFLSAMQSAGAIAGVCRSPEEAIKLINGGK